MASAEYNLKMVQYEKYCKKCIHRYIDENKEPCEECISEFANIASHKPIKFEEKVE